MSFRSQSACSLYLTQDRQTGSSLLLLKYQALRKGAGDSYSQFILSIPVLSHPPCQVLVLASGMQTNGTRAPGKGTERSKG